MMVGGAYWAVSGWSSVGSKDKKYGRFPLLTKILAILSQLLHQLLFG